MSAGPGSKEHFNQQLAERKKLRDIAVALIASVLTNGFLDGVFQIRTLAFNDSQRNAIHEQHNVQSAMVVSSPAFNFILISDMEDIFGGILPVDVLQRETAFVSVNGLRQ